MGRLFFCIVFFACFFHTFALTLGASESSLRSIDTGYALYLGNFTAPFNVAYLGIPYAAHPLGALRFRAPRPLDTSSLKRRRSRGEITEATTYPNFCIQGSTGGKDFGGAGTEDCLKVNIHAPVNATSSSKRESTI